MRRFKKSWCTSQSGLGVRFAFAEVLPIALFKELRQRLKDEFSKTGNQATFTIQVANQNFSTDLLQAYYREVFEDGPLR